jgi:hypothetical protein
MDGIKVPPATMQKRREEFTERILQVAKHWFEVFYALGSEWHTSDFELGDWDSEGFKEEIEQLLEEYTSVIDEGRVSKLQESRYT